jgi:hypothetical protein
LPLSFLDSSLSPSQEGKYLLKKYLCQLILKEFSLKEVQREIEVLALE